MSLCEYCDEGKLEMCDFYRQNFLESGAPVRNCPVFRPEENENIEVLRAEARSGKVRILTSRCMRKAMAGERVMLLTAYKAAQARGILGAIAESELKGKISSIHIEFCNGGEIVIGGVTNADQ